MTVTGNNVALRTESEIQQWILRRLGAPLIQPFLTQCQLDDVVEDAKRWFAAKKGVKRNSVMAVSSGVQEYELPDEVDTVIDIVHPSSVLDFSLLLSPFTFLDEQQIPYQIYAAPRSGGLYSTLAQAISSVEMAKRVLGAEQDWRQEFRTLHLFPSPKLDSFMRIEYKSNIFTVEQLNERDHDLVKRYALALAKGIAGLVMDKSASYPGAQGSVQLNAKTLLGQSEKELETLEEEIALSGFPLGLMTG